MHWKGFPTLIHKRIDPFSPPLLLNLFSLAPPSTKGKTKNIWFEVIAVFVLCWGLVCVHVHFMCMCVLVSGLCEMTVSFGWTNYHTDPWHFLVCQCLTSLLNFLTQTCVVVVKGSVDRSTLHVWSSTRLCTRSQSFIISDAVLAVLFQYLRGWRCDHLCKCEAMFLFFCDFGVKNKIACVICLGRIPQENLFVIFWVKIQ